MDFLIELIRRDRFIIESGSHNRDSIIIVLEGQFSCTIDGKTFIASPDDVCVFYRETVFERSVLQSLRCVYIQFESFPLLLPTGILTTADPARAKNTISHLAQAVAQENAELCDHLLNDLFLMNKYQPGSAAITDSVVTECIALMENELSSSLSLDGLSQRLAISKQWLIQRFKRSTGKTPMEYLTALRISQGKRLLKDTLLPVGEIAVLCGFENVYYFSNRFKHATGLSPMAYRKMTDL